MPSSSNERKNQNERCPPSKLFSLCTAIVESSKCSGRTSWSTPMVCSLAAENSIALCHSLGRSSRIAKKYLLANEFGPPLSPAIARFVTPFMNFVVPIHSLAENMSCPSSESSIGAGFLKNENMFIRSVSWHLLQSMASRAFALGIIHTRMACPAVLVSQYSTLPTVQPRRGLVCPLEFRLLLSI